MAKLNLSQKFVDSCSPVIDSNYDTCGTITRSSIAHLIPTDLNALFTPGGLFADLDAWFHHSIEMKACGVERNAWYDWIMANADRTLYRNAFTPGIKAVKGPGLLQPFIMGRTESVVNRDHWKMENGIANSGYTGDTPGTAIGTMSTGPLTAAQKALGAAGDRVIRVTNRWGIPLDPNWFRPSDVIHIFTLTASVAQMGNWRVLAAAIDTSATYIDVLATSENGLSNEPFSATPGQSAQKGVIVPGINNVNDYEKWCTNFPNVDPRKMVPFWYQSRRNSRCVDQEYLDVYKRLLVANEAFRQFGDLDLAERNRQDESEAQRRFVNAFFFQKPFNTNQTLALWQSLPAINTVTEVDLKPGLGGKIKARRANFLGVKEQLRVCSRVRDLNGQPLNLFEFLDELYRIKRARESRSGKVITDIDVYTNEPYQADFHTAMMKYYTDFYNNNLRFVVEVGKTNELGMRYDTYRVKYPAGININIISSKTFDDWRDEFNSAGIESAGNLLLILDIGKPGSGSIYWAQIAANRKQFTTARIEELAKIDPTFRCVMETTSVDQTLTSETGTVVVECPLHSLWIDNVGTVPPVVTGKTVNPDYLNLY